jgi:hypothetical protein
MQIEQGFISIISTESSMQQPNTIACFFFVYAETGILKEKENGSIHAMFLVWYLSVRTILTERGIVLRIYIWPGDLRLNSYRYSRTPRRTSLYLSLVDSAGDHVSRCYVMDPLGAKTRHKGSKDPRRDPRIHGGSRDPTVRRFYIRLGRHPLDRSFVLNSNSILIYWYSFTSNELYFQV